MEYLFENTVRQKLNALPKDKKKQLVDLATAFYADVLEHITGAKKQEMIEWTALQLSKQDDHQYLKRRFDALTAFFNAKYTTINFKNPNLSLEELEEQNETWHNELSKSTGMGSRGALGKPIIKFPDGWQWVNLDKASCEIEGKAMGHCGNASPKPNDNIYSLRDPRNVPYLTFIVNDKSLGEMKGRSNNKPEIKFHPYIMALLKSPYVEKIHGGGFAPQNNFKIGDLSNEDYTELHKSKPDLLPSLEKYLAINKNLNPNIDEDLTRQEPNYFQNLTLSMFLDKDVDGKGKPKTPEAEAVVNHIKKIRPLSFALITNDTEKIKNGIHELLDQMSKIEFYSNIKIFVDQVVMLKRNNSALFDYFVSIAKKRNSKFLGDVIAELYKNNIKISDDLLAYIGQAGLNDILSILRANEKPVPKNIQKLVDRYRLFGDYIRHRRDYDLHEVIDAYLTYKNYASKPTEIDPHQIVFDKKIPEDFDYEEYFKYNSIITWDEVKNILDNDLKDIAYNPRTGRISDNTVDLLARLINSKNFTQNLASNFSNAITIFAKHIKTDNKLFWQRLYSMARMNKDKDTIELISQKLGHEFLPHHMKISLPELDISEIDFADANPEEIYHKFKTIHLQNYYSDARKLYNQNYLKPIWSKLTRQQIKDVIYKKFPSDSMFIKKLTSTMTTEISPEEFPGYFNDLYNSYDINSTKESGNLVRNLEKDKNNEYLNILYAYNMFYNTAAIKPDVYNIARLSLPYAIASNSKKSLDYIKDFVDMLQSSDYISIKIRNGNTLDKATKLNILFTLKDKNQIISSMGYPLINKIDVFLEIPHMQPPFFSKDDFQIITNLAEKMNKNPYSLIKELMQDILNSGRLIPYNIAKFFDLDDKWKDIYNNLPDKYKERANSSIKEYEKIMENPDTAKPFNDKKEELASFKEWFRVQWNKDFGF